MGCQNCSRNINNPLVYAMATPLMVDSGTVGPGGTNMCALSDVAGRNDLTAGCAIYLNGASDPWGMPR